MANMPSTNKVKRQGNINCDLARKVEKKYMRKGDDEFTPYIRAMEDAVRDVVLDSKDLMEITKMVQKNEEKRRESAAKRRIKRAEQKGTAK